MVVVRPCLRLYPTCNFLELDQPHYVKRADVEEYIAFAQLRRLGVAHLIYSCAVEELPENLAVMEVRGTNLGTLLTWELVPSGLHATEVVRILPEVTDERESYDSPN